MSDLEIITEIESRLPRELKKLENITWFSKGYILNEDGRVTHLSIFNVRLNGEFPQEIFQLEKLEYLDIRDNVIENIPDEIGLLKNLKYLDIRYNELSFLPESFNSLKNLKRLYLGYNNFRTVPDNLQGLEKLFLIDFTENAISSGVYKLFELPAMTNIYLKSNRLKKFPFDLIPENKIKELNISENMIKNVPSSVYDKIERIFK